MPGFMEALHVNLAASLVMWSGRSRPRRERPFRLDPRSAAEIVAKQGDVGRARNELQAYLNSGKLEDRETVEA